VGSLTGIAPLLQIYAGSVSFIDVPPGVTQTFDVSDAGGADLGTAYASVFGSDILGIDSAQFTVQSLGPSVDAVEAALTDSGIDFSNADFTASDLATALTGFNPTGPWIPTAATLPSAMLCPRLATATLVSPRLCSRASARTMSWRR
jgi:hypothetical protein